MTALDLLWQAALVEQATESYFSIRVADRASAERRRAIDEVLARDVIHPRDRRPLLPRPSW